MRIPHPHGTSGVRHPELERSSLSAMSRPSAARRLGSPARHCHASSETTPDYPARQPASRTRIAAVAPQTSCSGCGQDQVPARGPSVMRRGAPGSSSMTSGSPKMAATSSAEARHVACGGSSATIGTMVNPPAIVGWSGSRPATSTSDGSSPISSSASRNAVATASSSPGSARPPGKLTCPAWWRSSAERRVSNTNGSGARTIGTSTAASPGRRAPVGHNEGRAGGRWVSRPRSQSGVHPPPAGSPGGPGGCGGVGGAIGSHTA